MRRKLGKGGISQKTWDYMRPDVRRMYNQIYPDHHYLRYSTVYLTASDVQAMIDQEVRVLAQFQLRSPRNICYRVVATDGLKPNHNGPHARAQWAYPTIDSVRGHLRWKHFQSPWISLFTSWSSALHRAKYFARECGATRICIIAVDLEGIKENCIDAYQFALAYGLDDPSLYREEVLCFSMIPESCLLAEIPAEKPVVRTALHSRLNVPADLLTEAISTYSRRLSPPGKEAHDLIVRDCEAVRCWLFDSIWSRSISEPQAKMGRIMQSFNT